MKFSFESESRMRALKSALKRIESIVLCDTEKCNKAFRIYEQRNYDITCEKLTRFTIEEIPIIEEYLKMPETPKKYSFKERIRIMFKGR